MATKKEDNDDTVLLRPLFVYPKRCATCKQWLGSADYIIHQNCYMHTACYSSTTSSSGFKILSGAPAAPTPAPASLSSLLRSVLPAKAVLHSHPSAVAAMGEMQELDYSSLKRAGWTLKRILFSNPTLPLSRWIETGLEWNDIQALINTDEAGMDLLIQRGLTLPIVRVLCRAPTARDMALLIQQKKINLTRSQWQKLGIKDNYQSELGLTWLEWIQLNP